MDVLNINYRDASFNEFSKPYESLSIGETFWLMNKLLLEFKNRHEEFKGWDNNYFAKFLWENFPPPKKETYISYRSPKENEKILLILLGKFKEGKLTENIIEKILTEKEPETYDDIVQKLLERNFSMKNLPIYEQEIVFIFSKIHKELGFPHTIEVKDKFPDCIVIDSSGEEKKIEFEYFASNFDHDPGGCDYIICWENDLSIEALQKLPPIISLEEFILEKFL